jgi:hypothetical protein
VIASTLYAILAIGGEIAILDHFERSFGHGAVRQQLIHPFDFGNAEEVMDNSLLYSLAAKTFPWRDQIESSSHLLVIGPRGCGKTTVFRSLSFKCLADADQIDDPHLLEDIDFAVLPGIFGVAENGAVWVEDKEIKHRVLYFLPQHIALVVPAPEGAESVVVDNMHQAYEQLEFAGPGFGVHDEPDWPSMTPMARWIKQRHPA